MDDSSPERAVSIGALKQRLLRQSKRDETNNQREAQGLPPIPYKQNKAFTAEELAKVAGYTPQPFRNKKRDQEANARDEETRSPGISSTTTMAPRGRPTEGDDLPEWKDVPVDPLNKVMLDYNDEHARVVLRFPQKFKTEYNKLVKAGKIVAGVIGITALASSVAGVSESLSLGLAEVIRDEAVKKNIERIREQNKRRAETNLMKATEESYRAQKPFDHIQSTQLRSEHLDVEKLLEMSGDKIAEYIGQHNQGYYLALLERYKFYIPEAYVRVVTYVLALDVEEEETLADSVIPKAVTRSLDASTLLPSHAEAESAVDEDEVEAEEDFELIEKEDTDEE